MKNDKIVYHAPMHLFLRRLCLLVLVCAGFLTTACDECEDCTFSENEPYITLQFFDSTTYISLTQDILFYTDTVGTLDSLATIAREKVEEGDSSYLDELEILTARSDSFGSLEIQSSNTRSLIVSGLFFPEEIIPIGGNDYPDPPTDSVNSLTLPLPMNGGMVAYAFTIDEQTDTLELSYRTFTEEEDKEYFVRAIAPEVLSATFPKGAKIFCNDSDTCYTDNAVVYVYY